LRVLLGENLPRRLLELLGPDVEATTVGRSGWKGKKNGELLADAQEEFDVLATVDKSMPHQQNLSGFDLGVVLLEAGGITYEDLAPLMDEANAEIRRIRPGTVARVTAEGRGGR
jgi:predicted nuclease of predicted toxin-antitoxin system